MAKKQDQIIITSLALRNLARLGYDLEISGAYLLLSIDAVLHNDNIFNERRTSTVLGGVHTNKVRRIFDLLHKHTKLIDDRTFELKPLDGLE